MDLADIPIFAMLRSRLGYLSERQKVLSQNIANASTPNYVSKDLKPFTFETKVREQSQAMAQASSGVATTQPGHMTLANQSTTGGMRMGAQYKAKDTPGPEVTLNGNSVVLEEEMIKMSDARMNYDAAIVFYQKSLNLLRLATRAPGRG